MTLSIEEIRLITEKLEKIDKQDLQKVVQDTLKIFQGLITASDAYNETHIKKFDKPAQWYKMDVEVKRKNPVVDPSLFRQIQTKIFQFDKSNKKFKSLDGEEAAVNTKLGKDLLRRRRNQMKRTNPSYPKNKA